MNSFEEKKSSTFKINFFVGLTLIVSAIIEIILNDFLLSRLTLPLTLMSLIYWNVATPRNIGFIWTMFSGLLLDIFLGYLLGTHIIIFLLTAYFSQRYFHRFRALFRIQQSLIVAMIIFIYQIYFILISKNFSISIVLELLALILISSLFWPIIYGILRYMRIKLTYGN